MSFAKIMEKYEEPNAIEKLAEEIRDGAFKSMESLWSAFLEVGDLDMVRAADTSLRLLTGNGDHCKAMKLLEGIYALTERAPSMEFTTCQDYPALAQMFMEDFLAESEEFIFDVGMDDVIDLILNEGE